MVFTGIKTHLFPHMLLKKFPTCYGMRVIKGDQLNAWTCYATTLNLVALKLSKEALSTTSVPNGTELLDVLRDETPMPQVQLIKDLETLVLHGNHPDRCVKIGTTLTTSILS